MIEQKSFEHLSGRPKIGQIYRNAISEYCVLNVTEDSCIVRRPKDGWTCTAHHPELYWVDSDHVELLWAYSTGGHFTM